jgi:pimeloyl-ACP methyl ester carboxylesterase
MLTLNSDPTFQYELLRVLGASRDRGADVGEVLAIAAEIVPGDFESWYKHFRRLADHVQASVEFAPIRRMVSRRNAMFRAASYYRAADFFLHGDPDDVRILETWSRATACFNLALALLEYPNERLTLEAKGFDVPAILYRPADDGAPRPTLLLMNGFDGSQEEMLHVMGLAALERGFNVVTFEGPGQPTVLRNQGLGFIPDWELVVEPVVTYCERLACVDPTRIALLGYSFGGFLAPRAAVYERRFAAVVSMDGVFDVYQSFAGALPLELRKMLDEGRVEELNRAVRIAMREHTGLRWGVEHGCWAFQVATPHEFFERVRPMHLRELARLIQTPVLVCEAENDHAFHGQPAQLARALGPYASYRKLTRADAAGEHCHVGASDFAQRVVMDWLEDTLEIEGEPRGRWRHCGSVASLR